MTPTADSSLPAPVAAAGTPPEPGAPEPAAPPDADAWAEVLAGWEEEARHRAYLARFPDLEGLARAGGRYRAVLAERPGDAMAERFRDEVVRRAMAQGLASLPRGAPENPRAKLAVRIAAGVVIAALLAACAVLIARMAPLVSGARP